MNWKRGIGSAILLAVLVYAAAFRCQPPPQKFDMGRRECPHTFPDTTHNRITEEVAGLDVPEFNDCQRFIIGEPDNLHYGDHFAIFAKGIANSIEDSLNRNRDTLAFSAAIVLGYGDYEDLGIRRGYNCLILWRERENGEWRAMMAPRDSTPNGACDDQGINPRLVRGGTLLSVERQKVGGFTSAQDYSGAARWGWDGRVQIAGIPCSGARSGAWCDVGPEKGFGNPGTYHRRNQSGISVSARWQKVTDIKGWHDEQLLALGGGDPGTLPRVSRIVGTVIPDSQLVNRTFADWEEAAQVALQGPEEQIHYYTERFGFTATDAAQPLVLNKIFACQGPACDCNGERCVTSDLIRGDCRCPSDDPYCQPDEFWYAKVVSADKQHTVYHRMCRYSVCDDFIPATARWRWLAGDEGTWFRCVHGCCELLGEE